MHADMNTCLCVHTHGRVNGSAQRKGERARFSHMSAGIIGDDFYVGSYWKPLGVKLLTPETMNTQMCWFNGCRVTASRLKWLLWHDVGHWSLSRISGRARAVPLFRPVTAKHHWKAIHCQGEEPDLLQCSKTTWNGEECALVAAVTCNPQQGRPSWGIKALLYMTQMKSDDIINLQFIIVLPFYFKMRQVHECCTILHRFRLEVVHPNYLFLLTPMTK